MPKQVLKILDDPFFPNLTKSNVALNNRTNASPNKIPLKLTAFELDFSAWLLGTSLKIDFTESFSSDSEIGAGGSAIGSIQRVSHGRL